jgi:hypothetical protein
MLFSRSRERELKMIWEVEYHGSRNYLAGTAHFFPYSLKKSLAGFIGRARVVLLEGPLDEQNMDLVRQHGIDNGASLCLREALDGKTIETINRELGHRGQATGSTFGSYFDLLKGDGFDPFSYETAHLKPWMAFFKIWYHYLKKRGWQYSVDLDVLHVAQELGKEIDYLETIEEQIKALNGIPFERIVAFFKTIDQWEKVSTRHVKGYLHGDLEAFMAITGEFPTRCESIVDRRDPLLFERLKTFYGKGGAMAFVGTIHIRGIKTMFEEEGARVTQLECGPRAQRVQKL